MTTSVGNAPAFGWTTDDRAATAGPRAANGIGRGIVQVALVIVPAMAAVHVGLPRLGGLILFGLTGMLVIWNLATARVLSNLALVVGLLPGTMLLRNLVLFHSVTGLLILSVIAVLLHSTRYMNLLARSGLLALVYCGLIYWLFSFMLSGEYHRNLRVVEMLGGAAAMVLLAQNARYLARAMAGMLVSLLVIGAALFQYGDRLGMAWVGEVGVGNPITFGLPLAFLLLLMTADGGRALLLRQRPTLRLLLMLVVGVMLLLTTSRGSWLVMTAGMLVILLFNRRHRRVVLAVIALGVVAVGIGLQTHRGDQLIQAYERTFSEERSLTNRTSGRSDQWLLFPAVLRDVPVTGFGPGSGPRVYAEYSRHDPRVSLAPGHSMQWHSLYQHITVEAGFVGMGVLVLLFGWMIAINLREWRRSGTVLPLLGTVGFVLLAFTVSGMDAASGLFLGLGMLPPTEP